MKFLNVTILSMIFLSNFYFIHLASPKENCVHESPRAWADTDTHMHLRVLPYLQ